jgi:hypothetical protein
MGGITPTIVCRALGVDIALGERSPICKIDALLLASKALAAKATSFSSSFLHIPTSNSYAPNAVSLSISMKGARLTSTYSKGDHGAVTVPSAATRAAPMDAKVEGRGDRENHNISLGLGKFLTQEISSACSCLSITPTAATITATAPTSLSPPVRLGNQIIRLPENTSPVRFTTNSYHCIMTGSIET